MERLNFMLKQKKETCVASSARASRHCRRRRDASLLILLVSLLLASAACNVFAPGLDEEHARLSGILDATARDLNLVVEKTTDNPPIECTILVGALNTGEFRKSRMLQLKASASEDARSLAGRLAERWRAEGFDAKVNDFGERGIFVNARDEEENSLTFVGYPNFAHISSHTACRKP